MQELEMFESSLTGLEPGVPSTRNAELAILHCAVLMPTQEVTLPLLLSGVLLALADVRSVPCLQHQSDCGQ